MNDLFIKDIKNSLNIVGNLDELSNKKVMIVGATGQIGMALVYALLQIDGVKNVFAHGRNLQTLKQLFDEIGDDRISYVYGDLIEGFEIPIGIDLIINAAGYSSPEAFRTLPVEIMKTAINGTEIFLEYFKNQGKGRYVFVSSAEVYAGGLKEKNIIEESDYAYLDVLKVRSSYPMGKRAAETLCESYLVEYGVDSVVARPSHVFGPTFRNKDNSAAIQFLKSALNHEDIIMYSEGAQKRTYTYITDIASGILTVAARGIKGEAYNIASDSFVSIKEFAEMCAQTGGKSLIMKLPDEKEYMELTPIAFQVLSNKKLKSLAWSPQFDVHLGIAHTISILKGKCHE